MRRSKLLILIILLLPLLGGCAAAVVGGVAAGTAVVNDRRPTGVYIDDQQLEFAALEIKYKDDEISQKTNINVISYNLVLLMTGQAESKAVVDRYASQLSKLARVKRVQNYVQIGAEGTWSDATSDAYLTTKAKLALFEVDQEGFNPGHVKVTTSLDTVYLMGIVTRAEGRAAADAVRYVSGVKRVVTLFEYFD